MPDLADLMRRVEELERFREKVSNGWFIRDDLFKVHMSRLQDEIKDAKESFAIQVAEIKVSFGGIKTLLWGTIGTIIAAVAALIIGKVL